MYSANFFKANFQTDKILTLINIKFIKIINKISKNYKNKHHFNKN